MSHHSYQKAVFIFRRDLRLEDNSALIAALRQAESVLTVFIADKRLLKPARRFANHFLQQSLLGLQRQIEQRNGQLCMLAGDVLACMEELQVKENVDAVFVNRDYTPYAKERDSRLQQWCEARNIGFHAYADQLLVEPEQALKKDATPYTVFTPFFRNATQFSIAAPRACPRQGFGKPVQLCSLPVKDAIQLTTSDESWIAPGQILANIVAFRAYEEERNFPALNKTTHLSSHLKFGTCSVREVYHCIKQVHGSSHPLIRGLFWRDFFTHIAWHFPYVFGQPFRHLYKKIRWSESANHFDAWKQGRTGFPIVDAGMRELNTTGFMHNRVRMIVASFLIKDLHIDWRKGEHYFRDKLLDYDACVNNGNWQWVASTGCDAQPWFRIFNPWSQQKKFDPDAKYIKAWIPELRSLDVADIHSPERSALADYPAPITHHATALAKTKQMYGKV